MRLTPQQQHIIREAIAAHIGGGARVWLFGSRTRDEARGGDLDLLVENDVMPSTLQRARVKLVLESALAMPVDVVGMQRGAPPTAFQQIAQATAVPLDAAA